MTPENYVGSKRVVMKTHSAFTEKWIQDLIQNEPSILGLGPLSFRNAEKPQPSGGRVDLILSDAEERRYEVEIQLGATDESHIIRTIEYWDNERKRYPQFEHCAVIIAEDITSRFFNVISLFNRSIPLIAIQMRLIQIDDKVTLVFSTILDENVPEEPPDAIETRKGREYWVNQVGEDSVKLVEKIFREVISPVTSNFELNYLTNYIGLAKSGRSNNFVHFRPGREVVRFLFRQEQLPEIDDRIQQSGMRLLTYDRRHGFYKLSISSPEEVTANRDFLIELVANAYQIGND